MRPLQMLLSTTRALLMRRADLALENLALRHQIEVLRRTVKRPHLEDRDRRLWILGRARARDEPPEPPSIERKPPGCRPCATRPPPGVRAGPVLGGLHHRYRAAS